MKTRIDENSVKHKLDCDLLYYILGDMHSMISASCSTFAMWFTTNEVSAFFSYLQKKTHNYKLPCYFEMKDMSLGWTCNFTNELIQGLGHKANWLAEAIKLPRETRKSSN